MEMHSSRERVRPPLALNKFVSLQKKKKIAIKQALHTIWTVIQSIQPSIHASTMRYGLTKDN